MKKKKPALRVTAAGQASFAGIEAAVQASGPVRPQRGITINQLSDETGADRRSIKKWLEADGCQPVNTERLGRHESSIYERNAALDCIYRHQKHGGEDKGQTIDPETGLTWFQAKVREDAIRERRENRIAERMEAETYLETTAVEKLVLLFIGKLELIPVKLESEFSLPVAAVKRLRELLDEARQEMAKGALQAE